MLTPLIVFKFNNWRPEYDYKYWTRFCCCWPKVKNIPCQTRLKVHPKSKYVRYHMLTRSSRNQIFILWPSLFPSKHMILNMSAPWIPCRNHFNNSGWKNKTLRYYWNGKRVVTLLPGSDVPGILNLEKVFLNFSSRKASVIIHSKKLLNEWSTGWSSVSNFC